MNEHQLVSKPATVNEFPLQEGTVYGPIYSRRLGVSLGINPLPVSYKFCDFDCVYCQYGWTPEKGTGEKLKKVPELLSEINAAFESHKLSGTPVKCITIAGNGEPTIYPFFLDFVKGLLKSRDFYFPKVPVGILSDSSQIHRPEIREGLELLDERYMKLDAGTMKKIEEINKPRGDFNLNRMVDELSRLQNIVIQTLFMEGSHDNTGADEVRAWLKLIKKINPREVQVYTIDRRPADPGLRKVTHAKLKDIAALCYRTTGVPSIVYE